MNNKKRKYLSEFAVNCYSGSWMMIPSSQINSDNEMADTQKSASERCHIYLICKRPSLSFDKDTFKYSNNTIEGNIIYRIKGDKKLIPFKRIFRYDSNSEKLILSDYPHREIHVLNEQKEMVRYLPASAVSIAEGQHLRNYELKNLEVLYVGQAFAEGKRSAIDRLKSHSTMQKILSETQYNYPDDEVSVLAFEYLPYRVITQMVGSAKKTINDKRDQQRFISILDNPLSEHQQICLIEAGLIRYFKPKYNEIYKENFPSHKHKILESCYDLDFSGLIVEINTDEFSFSLFSKAVGASEHHISKIDLINHTDRYGFFHFFYDDDKPSKLDDVISGA